MQVIFIRHAQANYEPCEKRGFKGYGRDLAPLTPLGVAQAEQVSKDARLMGADVIITSPYTRSLHTAAIISRQTGLKLEVAIDLHEWIPDKTYQYKNEKELQALRDDFSECKGRCAKHESKQWETIDEIIHRVTKTLDDDLSQGLNKIIVVTHGGVIRRFVGQSKIDHCRIYEITYHQDFMCYHWID